MAAAAPATFSTITGCPTSSESFCATGREKLSVGPPGGKGTIHLIGFVGYCAKAFVVHSKRRKRRRVIADPTKTRPASGRAGRNAPSAPGLHARRSILRSNLRRDAPSEAAGF